MSDRVEGTVREYAGKAQAAVGDAVGDAKTQAEGRIREAAGKLQDTYGQATEQLRDWTEDLTDRIQDSPLLAMGLAVGLGFLLGRMTARD